MRFLFLVIFPFQIFAINQEFLSGIQARLQAPSNATPDQSYIWTNEEFPQDSGPIVDQMPDGVYLTTGGERAFIMGALAKNATHIIVVERDPQTVKFLKIERVLLKVAGTEDWPDYYWLRTKSQPRHWSALSSVSGLTKEEVKLLNSASSFKFWRKSLPDLHTFSNGNYVRDEKSFKRMQALARAGKISILNADFTQTKNIQTIAKALTERGLKVGMLDISNAHGRFFMGGNDIQILINILDSEGVLQKNALLMAAAYLPKLVGQRLFAYTGVSLSSIVTSEEKISPVVQYMGSSEYIPNSLWKNRIIGGAELKNPKKLIRSDRDLCARNLQNLHMLDIHGQGIF